MTRTIDTDRSWDELLDRYASWYDFAVSTLGGESVLVEQVGRWIRERDVFRSAPALWHGWMDLFSQDLLVESSRGWSDSVRAARGRPVPPLDSVVRRAVTEVCVDAAGRLARKQSEGSSIELHSICSEIVGRPEYLDRELVPEDFGTAEQLMELAVEAEDRRSWERAADLHRRTMDEIRIRRDQLSRLDTDDDEDELTVERAMIPDERLRASLFSTANRLAAIEIRRDRLPDALSLHMSFATKAAPMSFWTFNDQEVEAAETGPPARARELWGPRAVLAYGRIAYSAYMAAIVGQADVLMRMGLVAPAVGLLIEVIDKGHDARSRALPAEARGWWSAVRDTITHATFPEALAPDSFLEFRRQALPDVHRLLGDLEYSEGNRWSALSCWASAAEMGDSLATIRLSRHGSSVEAVRAEAVARATGRYVESDG